MRSIRTHYQSRKLLLLLLLVAGGCGRDAVVRAQLEDFPIADAETVRVDSNVAWIDSGTDVLADQPVTVSAWGRIQPGKKTTLSSDGSVGPEGTYFYSDSQLDKKFPLPIGNGGPAPCFCLMGRIDQGEPFYLGAKRSWFPKTSGRLYFGINDDDVTDNRGHFEVRVETESDLKPVRIVERTPGRNHTRRKPVPDARVVVFYLDGLRPDVVNEMTAMGHLPNINRLFVEGGIWLDDTFTGFPSDTITSNGTMWTGCFSDRHGLKGQVRFSRRTLHSESYLEPLGPNRSSRLLEPQGIDRVLQSTTAETYNLTLGADVGDRWRQSQTSGIPPLYQHLRDQGRDWATGVLPMMTEVPPMLWTRSLIRNMPYLRAHDAWEYIDDANTHFAIKHLIPRAQPVTIVWLPETDSVSHKKSRGQFGVTRRTIALADRMIGKIVDTVEQQGLGDSTYYMLVSDHGHHGGRDSHLTHFDLANDLFHRPRKVDQNGKWVGGGLGLSVREHRFWNRHPEDGTLEFIFLDGDSAGAARIFLPKGHYRSGEWYGTSSPSELLAYRINDKTAPLNLPETIVHTRGQDGRGLWEYPVDLVLMRLDENSILITTRDRGQATIDRKLTPEMKWVYRYRVVTNVAPDQDGKVAYRIDHAPQTDPLELVPHLPANFSHRYFDEAEWLDFTADSTYPDGVVALTRHMLWQSNLKYREEEFAPDLVVTAKPNWYFGHRGSPGTMHGYPLGDAMRATWFASGPNIRKGARLDRPSRLADLTPTILTLIDSHTDPADFDGHAILDILEPAAGEDLQIVREPRYWNDLDLHAWHPLDYLPASTYEYLPWSMNRPDSPIDVNNLAYNLIAIGDINVWRIFDDVLSPVTGDQEYVLGTIERVEEKLWNFDDAAGEAARALDISGMTLADYSQTSIGNLKRADRAVDWIQKRAQNLDQKIAAPFGTKQTPPSKLIHGTVDLTQVAIWEAYRFGQRVVVQVIDETLLNGLENTADRKVNHYRNQIPAEIVVPMRR